MSAGSSTIGPREVLMSLADGFIACNSAAATNPFVLWLRTRWIVRMSALRKSSSLESSRAPHVCAFSAVRFWLHAEREAASRILRANIAKAENAERLTVETVTHRELPAAGAQMGVFQCDLTRARKDESPGHLDGGPCIVPRMRHDDTSLGRGLYIDGRVARTGRCDQLQSRQALDDCPGQRCALAHDADHIERQEALDNLIGFGQMVIEDRDHGATGERRPVGHLQRHVLIIVQDGYADHYLAPRWY